MILYLHVDDETMVIYYKNNDVTITKYFTRSNIERFSYRPR